ncbi:MAG: ATP-dependent RecD-like DNA helicase [Christensenellaceae bacterium]|jgi:exodeoxyribonuclease V alpha subunit|nr:ATP-dependent RecD-like DNA helicase [Christensenellaceae bacterium]
MRYTGIIRTFISRTETSVIMQLSSNNPGFIKASINANHLDVDIDSLHLNDCISFDYTPNSREQHDETVIVDKIFFHIPDPQNKARIIAVPNYESFPLGTFSHKLCPIDTDKSNIRIKPSSEGSGYDVSVNLTTELIAFYLKSRLFKGIGPKIVDNIIEHFGIQTFHIISKFPNKLTDVRGIADKTAKSIADNFNNNLSRMNELIFLMSQYISFLQAEKIYNEYKTETIGIILHNPYVLINDIYGIGFKKADDIAQKIGIPRDSEFRIKAGIEHTLKEQGIMNGHTCYPYNKFIPGLKTLLGFDTTTNIKPVIDKMLDQEKLFSFKKDINLNDHFIALSSHYLQEDSIAKRLNLLVKSPKKLYFDYSEEIAKYQHDNEITLDDDQINAIETALNSGVLIITGGPGTGKTTIINGIIKIFKNLYPSFNSNESLAVRLAAPTGRAAKRLTELTGEPATTIHRLLGFTMSDNRYEFQYNSFNTLEAEVIIIDEISMADVFIFDSLLKALARGTRLILVGDKDQLPSVSPGNVLSDIISSEIIPVCSLEKIYRQAENSLIVENAHRINTKQQIIINNDSDDFYFYDAENDEDILKFVLSKFKTIPSDYSVNYDDIQVLSPIKDSIAGTKNLNIELEKIVNPDPNNSLKIGEVTYKVGDRIMQTSNNYYMHWIKEDTRERSSGIFNGEIGYITEINSFKKSLTILFDDNRVCYYNNKDCQDLMLSYAITVHKSQGSEFSVVIVVLPQNTFFMTKKILYTAVTRAKKAVILIGSINNVSAIIKKTYTEIRYTYLKELLCQYNKMSPQNLR